MTETQPSRPAVVIYAALSKKADDEGSIDSQIGKVRARLEQLYPAGSEGTGSAGSGCQVVGTFSDDGYSGSKRDRGPGLEAAIAAVTRAATERGTAELWANTSARFSRGTGGPKAARALGALYYVLKARGVALRTVADDDLVTNEMLIGFASRQAAKYAEDLSESVTRAKRRQAERGEHLGGPLPIGYGLTAGTGHQEPVIDPDTAPTVRRIFELAAQGVPDAAVARAINAEGYRTRAGRPFDRRAVQSIVANSFYAARIVYEGDTFQAGHEPLIDAATFDRIQAARAGRDHAEPHEHTVGRPAQNHALAKLARCKCGERMYAVTSSYRRKNGSRKRTYVCHAYHFSTGTCNAKPIDAEPIDSGVIAGLDSLLVDFEGWRQRLLDGHAAEGARLADEVERAQRDYDAQANRASKVEAKWSEYVTAGDDRKADLVLPMVERERQGHLEAERRLQAAKDALASVPTDVPADALLDFANALQEAIRGRLDQTGTMAEVNQALREMFECFLISETPGTGLFDGILVQPWLRAGVIAPPNDPELGWAWPKLVKAADDPPPLRWLQAVGTDPERNEQNSQA